MGPLGLDVQEAMGGMVSWWSTGMSEYPSQMLVQDRLLAITDGETLYGYCTYLLADTLEEAESYYHRDLRIPIRDRPDGPIIYIEQLEGLTWSRGLMRQLQALLTQRHPQWTHGVWYRASKVGWKRYTLERGGRFHGQAVASPCAQPV